MNGKTKRVIQVALLGAFLLAAARLLVVYRERNEPGPGLGRPTRPEVDTGLDADAYVGADRDTPPPPPR